ncbi:MAG: glycosyltransferase [Saprospiraceae bacterium]|nr:MAG: glycosyltransferase [Saprospiraceae bacterium]
MTTYLQERTLFPPLISGKPSPLLGIVVVIPCYDEEFLLLSLMALQRCDRPCCDVEVIVLINDGEKATATIKSSNHLTFEQACRWVQINSLPHLRFHILYKSGLPEKYSGVGLARKIGMDEACYRFEKAENPSGIIACFDADSQCEKNYLQAIERHFAEHPKAQACGIFFEHPLVGFDFDTAVYEAITRYELHLRYYVQAQRWSGFPHAWQTIGSGMAVRCEAYQKQGGMNRRQAGEDFYFLHKFIPLGHYSEITSTKVIPSPRPSHRVPFGTGKAVGEMLKPGGTCLTYHPRIFEDLRLFLQRDIYGTAPSKGLLAGLPESIQAFLEENQFGEKWQEIHGNTSSSEAFMKRFYRWFDAFMLMKFVHYARDHFYPFTGVEEAARWLLRTAHHWPAEKAKRADARAMLMFLRKLDLLR